MLGWLFGKKPIKPQKSDQNSPETIVLEGDGSYDFDIVGEASYQPQLSRIVGGKSEEGSEFFVDAMLVSEPKNAYDKKAIAVKIERMTVGYVGRDDLDHIRILMGLRSGEKKNAKVKALIVGGWLRKDDEGHFGVKLDI